VNGGFLPIHALRKLQRPIIWTLHDSWPFTGGCHIPYDCDRYRQICGDCPQLQSRQEEDLSRRILKHKLQQWRDIDMTIVSPSRWLAGLAAASTLFRDRPIEVIPNGLDLEVFAPIDKMTARHHLGLPANVHLLLFSANGGIGNWNKGGDLLRDSLNCLRHQRSETEIVVLLTGSSKPPPADFFPMPVINYGVVNEDARKRLIYAAADITVVPSRSENLVYVAMESMACGTPCVGFSVGGIPDIIDHRENGYLAEALATEDFAVGISWIIDDDACKARLSRNARQKIVAKFGDLEIARRYEAVYRQVLELRARETD
jgi:glycosyltransferase involved in cell wall biosynthesis